MKHKIAYLSAFLLVALSLLFVTAPLSGAAVLSDENLAETVVYAEESADASSDPELEIINADILERAAENDFLSSQTNGLASDVVMNLLKKTFNSVLNKSQTKIANWASKEFMGLIFGTEESDTEKILNAIAEVEKKQDETLHKINEIKNMLEDKSTLDAIAKMMDLGEGSLYNRTSIYLDALVNVAEGKEENGRKQVLLWAIGGTSKASELNANGISTYDDAVLELGNKLLSNNYLLDKTECISLNLMNKYDLRVNKWEHQGYTMREEYWNSLINLYISSASLMQTSLVERMEEYVRDNPENDPNILRSTLNKLTSQLAKINEYIESTSVKRLPDNLRHYQVPGHEAVMYTEVVNQNLGQQFQKAGRHENYRSSSETTVNKYWEPIYTVASGALKGKVGITASEYQNIYDDYNPKGSTTHVSLYDIFFGEQHGNFTRLTDSEGKDRFDESCNFVSSNVWTQSKTSGSLWYYYVCCAMFSGKDASHLTWKKNDEGYKYGNQLWGGIHTVVSYFSDGRNDWHAHLPNVYRGSLLMVVSAKANSAQSDSSVKNHELKDGWKSDENFHWLECVEGDAVAQNEHTFEWVIDKPATIFSNGIKHEGCSVCGRKRNENTVIKSLFGSISSCGGSFGSLAALITLPAAAAFIAVACKKKKKM